MPIATNRAVKAKPITRALLLGLTLLAAAAVLCTGPAAQAGDAKAPAKKAADEKKPAATVNGRVITMHEYQVQMARVEAQLLRMGRPPGENDLPELQNAAMETLIDQVLMYQASQKAGVKVDPQELDKKLAEVRGRFPTQQAYMKALLNSWPNEKAMRAELSRDLKMQKFIRDKFVKPTKVPAGEMKAFYAKNQDALKQPERCRARHILVQVESKSESDDAKAKKKIAMIKAKADAGEDFAALAKKYSDGPSKVRGGDLGFFTRQQMVKPFADVAFASKPGTISPVVKTQFGYHVIKVLEIQPAGVVPYEKAEPSIKQHLTRQKVQKKIEVFLADMRKNSQIKVFVPIKPPAKKAKEAPKS